MRGVKCSWKEMQRLHREVLPALMNGDGAKYAELRCVQPSTVSQWQTTSKVLGVLDDAGIHICEFESFQPSHARELAVVFRKRSKNWDDDTKEEILDWVDRCENEGWTVQQLRDELDRANRDDVQEAVSHGIITDLNELVSAGAKFGAIYADPPWSYDNKATRSAVAGTQERHRDCAYKSTMTVDEICAEPVGALAEERSHLHLWTTNAFLFDAKRVMDAWGFEYKSCFVWAKTQMGIGNYWRVSHEFMLLGVRGGLRFADKSLKSWAEFPRTKHSRKPREVRDMVERASPGPYLEMYGREALDAPWTVYGNEVVAGMF